jgi:hypothetical protein
VIDLQVGLNIFMAVLIFGTIWRLTEYHLVAAQSPWLVHLGTAMAVQY